MNTVSDSQLNQNYFRLLSAAYGSELAQEICASHGLQLNQMPSETEEQTIAA